MSNEHGNLIKSPKQLIIMVFASFFVPLIIILLLMVFVNNGKRGDSSTTTEQLIKPMAQLNFKGTASGPREPQTGEQVYKAVCVSCHTTGAAGAPKFGDAGAWASRLGKGYDGLLTSVLKGKGAMPARGGSNPADISDYELGRAVVYLANSLVASYQSLRHPKQRDRFALIKKLAKCQLLSFLLSCFGIQSNLIGILFCYPQCF